jgi:hypothetical protein
MKLRRDQLMFPHCWVCEVRFKNSVPPGPANREDHHIWPRNAGGEEGPLVSLCDSHHATLHKIAQRLHTKKSYTDLIAGESQIRAQKLLWLGAQVVKAEQSITDDPNKLLRNSVQLNQMETIMVKRLQKMTGKTREQVLRAGLHVLYGQYFKD